MINLLIFETENLKYATIQKDFVLIKTDITSTQIDIVLIKTDITPTQIDVV